MKNRIAYLMISLMGLFISPSCSKKSSSSTPSCQIVTVTDQLGTTTTTYNITYDNSNRISTEQYVSNGVTTNQVFTYIGNTEIMSTSNGTTDTQDSITLNSDGLIVSDYYSSSSGGSSVTTYTYSGTELQKAVLTSGTNPPQTTTYTWSNGDVVSSTGSPNITYSYNTKATEIGDYWQVIQLINYGATFIKTAHQLAGYQYNSTVENINYTYDNTGKITAVTGTSGSDVENITYQYTCN